MLPLHPPQPIPRSEFTGIVPSRNNRPYPAEHTDDTRLIDHRPILSRERGDIVAFPAVDVETVESLLGVRVDSGASQFVGA